MPQGYLDYVRKLCSLVPWLVSFWGDQMNLAFGGLTPQWNQEANFLQKQNEKTYWRKDGESVKNSVEKDRGATER